MTEKPGIGEEWLTTEDAARAARSARQAERVGEFARLKALVGVCVWYYDRNPAGGWRLAVVTGIGAKDGYPIADVTLDGRPRWGYGWQFVAGAVKPPEPDLSKAYP